MIDFERWRIRRRPRQWLLVRPGGELWSWLRVRDGETLDTGLGRPQQQGPEGVALIVPGTDCGHFHLAAPPGLKREEWPLLLEDRLLQGPDDILAGCVSRQPGRLELVVIDRQRLAQWLEQCDSWGLTVERCWAEFQLLPELLPGSAWCWQRTPALSLYKGSTEDARQAWLAWPTALGTALPTPWRDLACTALEGAWPARLASLERLPSLLEPRRAPRVRPRLGTAQRRLAIGCALLALLWCGLWLGMQWRQGSLYQAQVVAVTGPVSSLREATQALKRQRQEQEEQALRLRRLSQLQDALAQWLQAQPGARLRLARFDGVRWHLHVQGIAMVSDAPWSAMASNVGAQVLVESTPDELRLVFDLGGGA